MKHYLTYKDSKSDKFWQIEVAGKSFTVTYGKTGTAGTSQTKTFENEEKCLREAEKLLNEKVRKGYKESEGTAKIAIAPPTPKKKKIDLTKLERELGVELPIRLKKFYDTGEYLQYEGMYVFGVFSYDDEKFKVKFIDPAKSDLLEENNIEMPDDEGAHYIPFSPLGKEPQFLGVDISKGDLCPVAMWEHEDGLFHIHSATLDEFLSRLLKKGQKTPFEKLDKAIDKASSLKEARKYTEALLVLEEASNGMSLSIPKDFEGKDKMARFFNLRGICCGELKNFEEALKNYRLAVDCLDTYSALNIIDYYIEEDKNYPKALETVTVLEKRHLNSYCRYHALNYKGCLHVLLGNKNETKKIYEEILKKYRVKDPDKIVKSVKDLEDIINKKLPHAEIASEILKEFGQKKYELSPQQIKLYHYI
jgi:predicted DNA-binding WGR domain protein